jgi:uncharacterized membrane protein (UPF0136 family)
MPYAVVIPIAAICLSCYFVLVAATSQRTKATVLVVLVLALFMPRVVPGRQFVSTALQLLLSIGLLLYFKAQPNGS